MITKISLVRHGLVHNPEQVYYGRLPGFGLAEAGRVQAAAAGRYLAGEPIAAIYHSPMLRAHQTAEIVRAQLPHPPRMAECDLLNEIFSPYDGVPVAEMEQRDWNFYHETLPPYESPDDILARIVAFFRETRAAHSGHHIVGVSHADPIAFAIMWACGLKPTADGRKRLGECGVAGDYPAPASVTTFQFGGDADRPIGFRYRHPAGDNKMIAHQPPNFESRT